MGRGAPSIFPRAARDACPRSCPPPTSTARPRRTCSRELPIAGIAATAGRALRPGLPRGGHGENTYGTDAFLLLNHGRRGDRVAQRPESPPARPQAGTKQFALEGSVFTGGAVVQWLRDGLRLDKEVVDVEKLALSVSDSGGVYLVPAFTRPGRAALDPYARGTVVGLTRGSNAGISARSALESIAFQSADLLHAMEQDSGQKSKEMRVDGGAAGGRPPHAIPGGSARHPVVRRECSRPRRWERRTWRPGQRRVGRAARKIAKQWKVAKRLEPKMKARRGGAADEE